MTDVPRIRPDLGPLSPSQRALIDGEPDLATQAMAHVIARYGMILPREELLAISAAGVAHGAQTWDATRGAPFRQWAFYRACQEMIDAARAERRHRDWLAAMRGEVFARLRAASGSPGALDAEGGSSLRDLSGLASGMADWMVGAAWDSEGDAAARADAARTEEALRQLVDSLKPWQRRVLALRFKDDEHMKRIAAQEKIDYRSLLRRHEKLMELLRARLRGLGITSMPAWFESDGPAILERAASER